MRCIFIASILCVGIAPIGAFTTTSAKQQLPLGPPPVAHLQHVGRIDIFSRAHGSKMTILRCIAMEIETRDESADNPRMSGKFLNGRRRMRAGVIAKLGDGIAYGSVCTERGHRYRMDCSAP
jgi:hypothetical protein